MSPADPPRERPDRLAPSEVLGSTHVNGFYDFTDEDYLNEGAAQLREMGTDVIRVWDNQLSEYYPYDSDWPDSFDSVTEVYRHEHFRELFDRPFSTFVLTSYARSTPGLQTAYWLDGVSDEQYAATVAEYEEATRHLLSEYRGTGKTFVVQHWEGDWSLMGGDIDPDHEPSDEAFANMRRWLDARQTGIERGRRAVDSDVAVLHATSVNRVYDAMTEGMRRSITDVVPETGVDMVAYSTYDVLEAVMQEATDEEFDLVEMMHGESGPEEFALDEETVRTEGAEMVRESLEFIHDHAPEPSPYVESVLTPRQKNVYVGEFGQPQNVYREAALQLIELMCETSLEWGARWAIFWQLYCNEPMDREGYDRSQRPENDDMMGFWLVRPDGSDAPARPYFESVLERDATY
jgi:hypothetical protein